MCLFGLVVSDIICCYTCIWVAVVARGIFEEYRVVDKLYIFCRIRVVYCYNKNLIDCYLLVVVLIVIAIIFAITILIVISISLCVVLSIFCFLILIVRIFALIICERICHRCNCKLCGRLWYLELLQYLLNWLTKLSIKILQILHRLSRVFVVSKMLSREIRVIELLVEKHTKEID